MKAWLRRYLGIEQLDHDLFHHHTYSTNQFKALQDKADRLQLRLDQTHLMLQTVTPALGRIISKLDAKYAESELSEERKAESDKIAAETIHKLRAEALARNKMTQGDS